MKTTKDTAAALVSSVIKLADSLRIRDAAEDQIKQADKMEAEAEAEAKASGDDVTAMITAAYEVVYGPPDYKYRQEPTGT